MSALTNLNKRLLIALGLSSDSAQIVIDHVAELTDEAGRLRTEIVCLKQDLKDAGMGRCTCTDCHKVVGNAWRDNDGHHCLTCLAKQRDTLRDVIAGSYPTPSNEPLPSMSFLSKLRGEPPVITKQDCECERRILKIVEESIMPEISITDDGNAVREVLNDGSFRQAIALEIADSRELALVERVGGKVICWICTVTACVVLTMIGCAVAVEIASR